MHRVSVATVAVCRGIIGPKLWAEMFGDRYDAAINELRRPKRATNG